MARNALPADSAGDKLDGDTGFPAASGANVATNPGINAQPSAQAFDWLIVEQWTAAILADDLSPIVRAFKSHGAQGPSVAWDPSPARETPEPIRFLLAYWTERAAGRALPPMGEIDALAMRPALGYIALLDVVDGARDFRYRLYGTILSAVAGFDMTGRLASEHKASPYITHFYMASYRAAVIRGRPFIGEHRPGSAQITKGWHRIVLPFAGADGSVQRFLVGGVPIGHDGRLIRITL